jgi:hypothetical protein
LIVFLAGLLVSVAGLFHTVAVTWAVGLLLIIVVFFLERFRLAVFYCIGAGLLVALWLLYALQFPVDFFQQYVALLTDRASDESLEGRLGGEVLRHISSFNRAPTLYVMLLLGICGFAASKLWKDLHIRALIVLTGLVLTFNALVVGGRSSGFYNLYPLTLVFCLLGIGIEVLMLRQANVRQRLIAAGTMVCVGAFVANIAALSLGPRVLAYWTQGPQRDYAAQMAPLSNLLRPGDQVWGAAPVWFAVVNAGGRLDAFEPVPPWKLTRPDPRRHKYVVMDRDRPFDGSQDYEKIAEFGSDLPPVLGASLTNKSYSFDLWRSKLID